MEETFGACALFKNSEMLPPDWLKGELTSESPTNHSLLLIAAHDVVKMEPWDSEQNTHFLWSAVKHF